MAVTRRAPWWLTYALCGGLFLLFLGERALGHLGTARLLLSGAGALAVLGAVAWRAWSWRVASDEDRRVERLLLLGSVGALVAMVLYALGTALGKKLGLAPTGKAATVIAVLWPIVLAISVLPLLLAQAAAGPWRQGGRVEGLRVSEAADSGLSLAFAIGAMFLVVWIASERDVKVDLSYFRTSMPGTATKNTIQNMEEPLKVLLFFPDVNEVRDEVKSYFDELARATGRVTVETHDRVLARGLAEKYKVREDGTVVLVRGETSELIRVGTELPKARNTLRTFDGEVQKSLMKIARSQRIAYLTIGHGEMNDRTGQAGVNDPLRGVQVFKKVLEAQNYKVKDLGPMQGLATEVPEDASIVFVLGPTREFLQEELEALDRYVERGGSLLVAVDPESPFQLGALEPRLGLKLDPTPIADDQNYMIDRRNTSDRRVIKTDRFSAHASVTTLSQAPPGIGIVLVGTGSLAEAAPAQAGEGAPKRTYVVRSMPNAFADKNGNHKLDEDEKRQSYHLVAAVEAGKARALVMADAQLFADAVVAQFELNQYLLADVVKWLGGEEKNQGTTTSEKDVEIQHTRGQDVAWFYSTIVGAPGLVLALGMTLVWRRRKRAAGGRAS